MDYPGQDFAILKTPRDISPISWSGQSHLDTHTKKSSTWLHPASFLTPWIRNSSSPVPKYSELLASHRGGLRSKGHLCPYSFGIALDSRATLMRSRSVRIIFHLHVISATLASWLRGQPTIWHTSTYNRHAKCPLSACHLVANKFLRTNTIDPPLSNLDSPRDFITLQRVH